MAVSRFIDFVTDSEVITQVTGKRAFVKRLCIQTVRAINGASEWPYLWTTHFLQTVAEHTTGNVDVTNGSATVSGGATSPVFTAAMVGRKFRVGNDTAYYTIKTFTSSTEIILDQVYTGDTDTDAEYSIYKDEFLLRADVDRHKIIRNSDNGIVQFSISASEFDKLHPSPTGMGVPSLDVFSGRAVRTYTTGTVEMTSGSRTLTGSSTAWTSAEGLTRRSKIKIGSLLFTVKSVDSDTSISTYEIATSAVGSGTSYEAVLDNYIIQFHAIPDEVLTMYYRYQREEAILDADNDIPDMPDAMMELIVLGITPTLWRSKGMITRALTDEASFDKKFAKWQGIYQQPVLDRSHPIHPFTLRRTFAEARWEQGVAVPLGIGR